MRRVSNGSATRRLLAGLFCLTLIAAGLNACTLGRRGSHRSVLRATPTLTLANGTNIATADARIVPNSNPPAATKIETYGRRLGPAFDVTFGGMPTSPVLHLPLAKNLVLGRFAGHQVERSDLVVVAYAPGPDVWLPLQTGWEAGADTVNAVLPYDITVAVLEPTRWAEDVADGVMVAGHWLISGVTGYANAIIDDLRGKWDELVNGEQTHMNCSTPKTDWTLSLGNTNGKIKGCLDSQTVPVIQFENDTALPLDVGPAATLHFKPKLDVARFDNLQDAVSALIDYASNRLFIPAHGVATATWYDKGQTAGNYISLSALDWAMTSILSTLEVAGLLPAAEATEYVKLSEGLLLKMEQDGTVTVQNFEVWQRGETTKLGLDGKKLKKVEAVMKAASCVMTAISSGDISRTFASVQDASKVARKGIECAVDAMEALGKESIRDALKAAILGPVSAALDTLIGAKDFATSFVQSIPLYGKFNGGPQYGLSAPGMSLAEAQALPHPGPADSESTPCRKLPQGVLAPSGAPAQISCAAAVTADLDGNGKPDQLVTWSKLTKATGVGNCTPGGTDECESESGAVAYLDDGSAHVLVDPVKQWPGAIGPLGIRNVGPRGVGIVPGEVVELGSGSRQQVSVTYLDGANTTWQAVLALAHDGTLRAVTDPSGTPMTFYSGGGANHPTGWGCSTSGGKPILAVFVNDNDPTGSFAPSGRLWRASYYRLQDSQLVFAGGRGDFSTAVGAGDEIDDADCRPGQVRPEVGPVDRGAVDPDSAVRTLVEAVNDNDSHLAEEFTDGMLAPQDPSIRTVFHGGDGVDVIDQIRSILRPGAKTLVGAPVNCARAPIRTSAAARRSPPQLCTISVAGQIAATFVVVDSGADPTSKWVVAQAFPGVAADAARSSFASPSNNILCAGAGKVPLGSTKLVGDPTIRCFIKQFSAPEPGCAPGQVGLLTLDYLDQSGAAFCAPAVDASAAEAVRVGYGTAVDINGIGLCQVTAVNVTCRSVGGDHEIVLSRKTISTN